MTIRRVALVTGSNKGIGLAVVRQLCASFAGDVILCSRDNQRGEDAIAILQSQGLQPKLAVLDICDPNSIIQVRDFLQQEYGGLDVLVNNAAVGLIIDPAKTDYEIGKQTLDNNYYSTISVCDILFPILRPGARVVNVSSSAGMLTMIVSEEKRSRLSSASLSRSDLDQLAQEYLMDVKNGSVVQNGWPNQPFMNHYSVSKVFLAALTWIQHREFLADERKDIVINAVHPGYVITDLTHRTGKLSPEQGAEAIVKCCLIPAGGEPRGQMVWHDGQVVDWVNKIIADPHDD